VCLWGLETGEGFEQEVQVCVPRLEADKGNQQLECLGHALSEEMLVSTLMVSCGRCHASLLW
jgi:hypothetical protein